jgi:predicted restriction endonuclease
VCDVNDASLLVASHIVPWALAPNARGDLSNIICLCRFHDPLFELGYWSLSEVYEVVRRPDSASHTIRLLLPTESQFHKPRAFPPDPGYLKFHRESHGL